MVLPKTLQMMTGLLNKQTTTKEQPTFTPATPTNTTQGGGYSAPTYLENNSTGSPSFTPPQELTGDNREGAKPNNPRVTDMAGAPGSMITPVFSPGEQPGAGGGQNVTPIAPPAMPQNAPVPQTAPPAAPASVPITPAGEAPATTPITETVDNMGTPGAGPATPAKPKPFADLGALIEAAYRNPSRYDAEQAKKFYDYAKGDLTHERDVSLSNLDAEAARRGVFHSSIPVTGSDAVGIGERYNRGLGDLATNIAREQATTAGEDRSRAFSDAFKFLSGALDEDKLNLMIAQLAGQLGQGGQIDFGDVLNSYGPMPTPDYGGGVDWTALGGLFANDNGSSGSAPAGGKSATAPTQPGAQSKKPGTTYSDIRIPISPKERK